ncbi:unnamed protein product [Closterium sp. NIES-64]|nr:unnamed protein product [Closterium sp. NIES-64]
MPHTTACWASHIAPTSSWTMLAAAAHHNASFPCPIRWPHSFPCYIFPCLMGFHSSLPLYTLSPLILAPPVPLSRAPTILTSLHGLCSLLSSYHLPSFFPSLPVSSLPCLPILSPLPSPPHFPLSHFPSLPCSLYPLLPLSHMSLYPPNPLSPSPSLPSSLTPVFPTLIVSSFPSPPYSYLFISLSSPFSISSFLSFYPLTHVLAPDGSVVNFPSWLNCLERMLSGTLVSGFNLWFVTQQSGFGAIPKPASAPTSTSSDPYTDGLCAAIAETERIAATAQATAAAAPDNAAARDLARVLAESLESTRKRLTENLAARPPRSASTLSASAPSHSDLLADWHVANAPACQVILACLPPTLLPHCSHIRYAKDLLGYLTERF